MARDKKGRSVRADSRSLTPHAACATLAVSLRSACGSPALILSYLRELAPHARLHCRLALALRSALCPASDPGPMVSDQRRFLAGDWVKACIIACVTFASQLVVPRLAVRARRTPPGAPSYGRRRVSQDRFFMVGQNATLTLQKKIQLVQTRMAKNLVELQAGFTREKEEPLHRNNTLNK